MIANAANAGSPSPEERARSGSESSGGGICVTCGSSLGLEGPDRGCLNCLARFALSSEDGEAGDGEPPLPSRTFGHFEIIFGPDGWPVELGRGAMGVTYRARDTVLHTEVALKVIGVGVAGHPAARAAFLREARAAARLRHPNVASVFHYGEQDGECYYVMELVEGETLEARLRREGPLPPTLVLEVGRQVACALAEAEARGIVHRDLKPSNLMFVARHGNRANDPPHVKIIDFGLAEAVGLADGEEGGRIAPAGFVGTPSFASPEQFARGGERVVDTRSDMYSLGVTLWYLLCGRLPFSGSTLTALHVQQTRPALPLEQLRAARVPGPVVALLLKLLKTDPRERPRSGHELLDLFVNRQEDILRGRQRIVRRMALALVIALITALAFYRSAPTARFASAKGIAVLPFQNLSPNRAEAFYTLGVQDAITTALGRIGDLTVIGPESTKAYPPGGRDLAKISRELGVDHLVEGTVLREPDHVRISVELIDRRDVAHPWSKQYEGSLAEAFGIQAKLTHELAAQLRAKLPAGVNAAMEEPPTNNPAAYDLYLRVKARNSMVTSADEFRRQANECFALLEQAVRLDPNFVLAYCEQASLHDEMAAASALIPEERAVDHRSLAEAALAKARRLKPDAGEVHKALARHLYLITRDNEQAQTEVDLARTTLPNDNELENIAGRLARAAGRWQDAVRALEKSVSLEPRDENTYKSLAVVYRSLRRYKDADRAYASVLMLAPPARAPYYRLQRATIPLDERADLAPLRAVLDELTASHADAAGNFLMQFQALAALFAHDPDALTRAISSRGQKDEPLGAHNIVANGWVYPKAWFEGLAARMRGDDGAARTAFAAAKVELENMQAADPRAVDSLSLLADVDAGLGKEDDAMREGLRARAILLENPDASKMPVIGCRLAVVYAWTDQPDEAFRLLDELTREPAGASLQFQPTYGDLRLDPTWDPLRKDARFDTLVGRLAPKTPR
jgi:TolB-like protein/Flp pilus assembly protein TadD